MQNIILGIQWIFMIKYINRIVLPNYFNNRETVDCSYIVNTFFYMIDPPIL